MNKADTLISDSKIIIATHEYATGFPQYMEKYLINKKAKKLLYIHHPLHPDYPNSPGSGYRMYYNGKLTKEVKLPNRYIFLGELFLKNFIQDIWWTVKRKEKWDLYIGSNNLNSFAGVILKKIGIVKKCVYYTVDFIPKRFNNTFINKLYLWLDLQCVRMCDETWILSPRVREGRKKYFNLNKEYDKKQVYVPEGAWIDRIKKKSFSNISKNTGVFLGVLLERMGVQLILNAIPYIIEKNPNFRFIIIGKGNYKDQLEKTVKKLKIQKHVSFKGYIKDYEKVEQIISSCAFGTATYTDDSTGLTYYADPAKVKTYLGCGLPIIMTDTFYIAKDIEKKDAGIITKHDPLEIAKTILSLLNNNKKLEKYRKRAIELSKEFDNNVIFEKNLNRVLKYSYDR